MVSKVAGVQKAVAALVVEFDPSARLKICQVLENKGIEVSACDSLTQGREHFSDQTIVLARAHGDHGELNGFVDWVRERSGASQPYIVAIDESVPGAELDKMELASANPGCDAVLQAPLDGMQLEERLQAAIDQWRATRGAVLQGESAVALAPEEATMTPIRQVEGKVELGPEVCMPIASGPPAPVPAPAAALPPIHIEESGQQGSDVFSHVLIENAPLAMAMFDREMNYLIANRRWHKEFHLENVAIVGRSQYEVFPNLSEGWRRIYTRCLDEGRVERCEEDLFERPDGSADWVRWEVRPWRKAEGSIGGLIVTSEVITPMRLHQRSAEFESTFTNSVLQNGAGPVMLVDLSGRIVQSNPACEVLFHQAGLDAQNNFYWEFIASNEEKEKEQDSFAGAIESLKKKGTLNLPASVVHHIPGTNGKPRRMAWANTPQINTSGIIDGLIRIGVELGPETAVATAPLPAPFSAPAPAPAPAPEPTPATAKSDAPADYREREAALLQERDTFLKIAQNAPFGVILLDEAGSLVYGNPQHKAVLGFGVEDARDIEAWLARGCPDEEYAREVRATWRDSIWRKQLTNVFTLATHEGLLKEIEFRPRLLSDGCLLLCFNDVTEQRRREEALRASETKFNALFQGSRVGMALIDKGGDFFDINAALEKMLGYGRWEMRRKAFADYVFPQDAAKRESFVEALAGSSQGVAETELRLVTKDDQPIWTRLNASAVRDQDGNLLFTAYTIHDISALKQAGKDLRDSQEQNRALLEATPDLIMLLDREERVIDLLPSTSPHLALSANRVIKEGFRVQFPELAEKMPGLTEQAHQHKGDVVRFEFTPPTAEGGTPQLEARVVSCGDDHTLVIVADVTDRHWAKSLKRRALAFDNIEDAIVLTDLKGRVTDLNPASERLFGFAEAELIGQPLYRIYDPGNPREFNKRISRQINAEHRWSGECSYWHKDGGEGRCEVLYVPVEEKGGGSKALVGITRPLRRDSDRTPHPGAPLSEADRTEISRVHQRVKNDLQIISSLLNLQLASLPDQLGRKMLKENQNRILAIAYIYRQLSAAQDSGSVNITNYMEALGGHLQKTFAVDGEKVDLRVNSNEVSVDIGKAVPLALIANELLSNALLHGFPDHRAGRVMVDFSLNDDEAVLKVSDSGVPLPMAFDLKDPATLGLQIVKILVEQLKGGIEIADSQEKEFLVRFPLGGG